MTVPAMAAAAATGTCPGRGWNRNRSPNVAGGGYLGTEPPSPPRFFTFEPPFAATEPVRPRRKRRRVLYPPAVRRNPPSLEEPNAAKRLLVLLLAVVSAQVYSTPGELSPDVVPSSPGTSPPAPIAPNGTLPAPAIGASCPPRLLAPTLPLTRCIAAY